jgi:hypothetical protein
VCELVLFIAAVLQGDEDSQVVRAGHYSYACACELGAQLIITSCANALLGTVDVEGGDGRVVRGLLGEVGDSHCLAIALDAVGGARRCRVGRLEGRVCVFDLPITLIGSVTSSYNSR